MRRYLGVLCFFLLVTMVWAQATAPTTSAPVIEYHPGLIVDGVSFVDVRQVAAIVGCRFDAVENYYVKLIQPTAGEVVCQMDGKIKGPADLITHSRPPLIYSDSCIFVPSKVFVLLGHRIVWDGKLSILTVDDTQKISVLEKTQWYAAVRPPQKVKPETPSVSYPSGEPVYRGDMTPPASSYNYGNYSGGGSYSGGSGGSVSVKCHYRNGHYVRPHTRSAPRR